MLKYSVLPFPRTYQDTMHAWNHQNPTIRGQVMINLVEYAPNMPQSRKGLSKPLGL